MKTALPIIPVFWTLRVPHPTGMARERNEGVFHLAEHILLKRIRDAAGLSLCDRAERIGAICEGMTDSRAISLMLSSHSPSAKHELDQLIHQVTSGDFDISAEEYVEELALIQEELLLRERSRTIRLYDIFSQKIFAPMPDRTPTQGSQESVAKIQAHTIWAYLHDVFKRGRFQLIRHDSQKSMPQVQKGSAEPQVMEARLAGAPFGQHSDSSRPSEAICGTFVPLDKGGREIALSIRLFSLLLSGSMSSRFSLHLRSGSQPCYRSDSKTEEYPEGLLFFAYASNTQLSAASLVEKIVMGMKSAIKECTETEFQAGKHRLILEEAIRSFPSTPSGSRFASRSELPYQPDMAQLSTELLSLPLNRFQQTIQGHVFRRGLSYVTA